jgi:hypothetical protein
MCEDYFEINQTPDELKTRLATMYFTDDARVWYRSYKQENPQQTWPVLA